MKLLTPEAEKLGKHIGHSVFKNDKLILTSNHYYNGSESTIKFACISQVIISLMIVVYFNLKTAPLVI